MLLSWRKQAKNAFVRFFSSTNKLGGTSLGGHLLLHFSAVVALFVTFSSLRGAFFGALERSV